MTGTGNELAVREESAPELRLPVLPGLPDTDTWIRAMASIAKLAAQICNTSFVPRGLRGDDASVTAAILTGRELGLPPMAALRHIHVVEGTPSLDAEYKRAKVLSLGHEFRILEWDDEHCKVAARRKGDSNPPLVAEYTIRDARRAGLVKDRGNYMTRPKVMLLARVTTLVTNAIFADVTNGLATTELLESGDQDAIADAAGAALALPAPERQRVTAADARARAPQTVTATVVTQDASPAATAQDAPPSSAPSRSPESPDGGAAGEAQHKPRLATTGQVGLIRKAFERLTGVKENDETPDQRKERLRQTSRLARVPYPGIGSTNELTSEQARDVREMLARCETAADLEALLDSGALADDPRGEEGEPA